MFRHTVNPDGTVNIHDVPVFKAHVDRRYKCDEKWLDRCVADFLGQKVDSMKLADGDERYAMLPPMTLGHTPVDPNAPEPPAHGFVDNLRRVGKVLYADFVNVSKEAWGQIKNNAFPYRSAEVIPSRHRLTNVSLLGGRYPHFALPVMRFRNGAQVLRYTYTEEPKDMALSPEDIDQLVEALVPRVAEALANGQANADAADSQGLEGADGQGSEMGEDEGNGGESEERFSRKGVVRPRRDPVRRYSSDGTISANGQRANFSDIESSVSGTPESGMTSEGDTGMGNPVKNMYQDPQGVRRYVAGLEGKLEAVIEQNRLLSQRVGELQRHTVQTNLAARRNMIRSKVREIAAMGYAVGDGDRIERHVETMMGMDVEGVRGYFEDVLKQMPRVNVGRGGAVDRHGVHDFVARPGRDDSDEAERYHEENRDLHGRLGIDTEVLRMADVLGGL